MSNYCWGIIANELKGRGTAVETLSSSRPRRFRLQPQLLTGGQVVVHRLAFVVAPGLRQRVVALHPEALVPVARLRHLRIGRRRFRLPLKLFKQGAEFQLPEEQKPAEDKIVHHIIIKADIRDSTTLTRTLFERGLNPASYFSLNFYGPVNKLLPKYNASKVFIEGDAVILALFEREGEPELEVARACVLAKEMTSIVSAYNEESQKAGLPTLELGIGISYQDAAPMYLMDGESRIMISKALNESDRLSSCNKGARHFMRGTENLYGFHEIAAFRGARSPVGLERTLSKTMITSYGRDFAVASTLFERGSVPGKIGQT